MIRRRLALAAVSLAAAITLAACGGGTTTVSTSPESTTATSAAPSAASSTATIQLTTPTGNSSSTATTTSSSSSPATTAPSGSGGASLAPGFSISSSAFAPGGAIPSQYTCDGQDISPPLQWTGVPSGTKELVLVMRDPDAPAPNFVHWAVAGIDPASTGFAAGGVAGQIIPGRNSFGTLGYRGPCPPTGAKAHHYVITLSALAGASGLASGFSADQLQAQALGIATLIGTYGRP